MTDTEILKEIKERVEKATEEKWVEFISHARTDILKLIEMVERRDKVIDVVIKRLEFVESILIES